MTTLKQLLEENDGMDLVVETEAPEEGLAEGMCVECTDTPQELVCSTCDEPFCRLCFEHLHRTGKRRNHPYTLLEGAQDQPEQKRVKESDHVGDSVPDSDKDQISLEETQEITTGTTGLKINTKFVPVRLTFEERKYFRLLQAALQVSEYTDKVDIWGSGSRSRRILAQLREMCTVLTGLVVANNMPEGQKLVSDKDFSHHADWFKMVFEIGRRYKIMNPERMRDTFGKLMYMIMDSRLPEVSDQLEFDLYRPIKTVHSVLEEAAALEMLDDPLIVVATQQVLASSESGPRSRAEIQRDIRRKENAVERLAQKYSSKLPREDIRQLLYSISDYFSYVQANRVPVDQMAQRLVQFTQPDTESSSSLNLSSQVDLSISYGKSGARLSHSHKKQYQYVLQSLTLWSEIMRDMYMLWKLADDDMCSETRYTLGDTGQGLNRIKACPKVGRAMYNIINNAQHKTGNWIGSSVVHLGDHAVPNALFFLDKYLQVPRILNPVNLVMNRISSIDDEYLLEWVRSQFEDINGLERAILVDFFRHAFDGSGADNFYDAGSCIDGRLTSAWNWANTISKKPYYNFFLVSGFTGFDGSDGF